MQSFDWGQFIASTFSVLVLLAGAWWWVRRNRSTIGVDSPNRRIQIVEALPLSLKHKMVLLKVDDQMVLASIFRRKLKPCTLGRREIAMRFNWIMIRRGLYLVLALLLVSLVMMPSMAHAQGIPLVNVTGGKSGQQYSMTLQLLGLMTVLTLLPSMLLMMTAFVRVIIVLSLLRQALGTQQTPPNTVLVGLALFLTFFIMSPVFETIYRDAVGPYMNGRMDFDAALIKAEAPIREFMTKQTREDDIAMFMQIANRQEVRDATQVPFTTLMPAFITSEIKSAFTIGFLIYIPFVVIDLIVSSVLMSMGMMMLSPMIISMPIKLMLFVLIDGWTLLMASLSNSFVY